MVFSHESCFQLCPDDNRKRVWRRPGERTDLVFTIARHTGSQPGVMYPCLTVHQDNARPHMTCVAMNCLTACQALTWTARLPDISAIENVWDMM
ncbi:transposable element Tc1 transposase [Trichonephila clavipes]|nr:transposable element Tc1 transposase [Trichonephila clavipes]